MRLEDLEKRVNQLIELADKVLKSRHNKYPELLNSEMFFEYRTSSLSFTKSVVGENHPYYQEFDYLVKDIEHSDAEEGRGVLKSIKKEI
ncbi:hypothetical protein [Zunongwangia sp. HRR-M8]|uniref:hypothetical protein n=1 Tax=Zunongwangia sp. HRR-M8 TaxID=3015170 RepID=UPI0022DE2026|nr:hypothetical protein [Zunongwangia sp. HRR-M8]WBL23838.1 hypothetical protein PBT89_07710 [Zunongwangia sp. HRR-M8]